MTLKISQMSIYLLMFASACELAKGTVVTGGKRNNSPQDLYSCSILSSPEEKSFCNNVWLVSRSVGCIDCHAHETSPLHAADDPQDAFREVLAGKKINFNNPELSALVEKIKNGHQQWGVGTDKANQVASLFLQGIQKLADEHGDKLAEKDHPYITQTITLPANIPMWDTAGATFPTVTIPLDNLVASGVSSTAGVTGARFQFTIARIGEVKPAYLLRQIRVVSSVPVEMRNAHTLMNGNVRATDQSFTGILGIATANNTTGVIPPGFPDSATAVIEMGEGGPGVDTLALAFEMLKQGSTTPPPPPIVNTATPEVRVANINAVRNYINTSCFGCHGNGGTSDGVNFTNFMNATANANTTNIDNIEAAVFATTMVVSGSTASARGLPLLVRGKPDESVLYVSINARGQTPVGAASVTTSAGSVATSPMPNNDQAATKTAAQNAANAIRKFLTEVR